MRTMFAIIIYYISMIVTFGFTGGLGYMCLWSVATFVREWIETKKVDMIFPSFMMLLLGIAMIILTVYGVYETIWKEVTKLF
jgi:hypothetical protein